MKSFLVVIVAIVLLMMSLVIMGLLLMKKEKEKNEWLQQASSQAKEKCVVRLISVGPEKIKVIKVMRTFTSLDLTMAKEKTEQQMPAIVAWNMPLDLAQQCKTELEKVGAVVEIN